LAQPVSLPSSDMPTGCNTLCIPQTADSYHQISQLFSIILPKHVPVTLEVLLVFLPIVY